MFRQLTRKKQSLPTFRIVEILKKEKRGVLSVLGDNGYPYGLPINYWYNEENGRLYFHSGKKGHKNDAIAVNNKVSFCVMDEGYRNEGEWALNISSVIIFGKIQIVESFEEAMKRLEEVLRSLEAGEVPIDRTLALYEEGVSLVKLCNKILDNAAELVKIITEKEDGFTKGEFNELDEK